MTAIKRKLPRSNATRQLALFRAVQHQNVLPPGTVILTDNTKTRLLAMEPQYNAILQQFFAAKANLNGNTHLKATTIARCHLLVSHFIQVFNLGVERGDYPAAHRAFYSLPDARFKVPAKSDYFNTLQWAENIIEGDAARIAAGGAPMANPSVAQVQAAHLAAKTAFSNQSLLSDALRKTQKELRALNPKADALIKRVWDEVETYYGEKPPEGKRNSSRLWGVQYVSTGKPAQLSGRVTFANGTAATGAKITLTQTGATATANHEGRFTVKITTTGAVHLIASYNNLTSAAVETDIPEKHYGVLIDVGVMIVV